MSLFKQLSDNEPTFFDWRTTTLRFACCDCGMVHDFAFQPNGAKSYVIFLSKPQSTAQLRRHKFGSLHKGDGKWFLGRI